MEIKAEVRGIVCDLCGRHIPQRMMYKNDGSFQSDSIRFYEKDYCLTCCARILAELTRLNLDTTEESYNKATESLKNRCMDLQRHGSISKILDEMFKYI